MGQYKVPQNVEAEDKIIGPLTLMQFIYCVIGVAWAGLCFVLFKSVMPLMVMMAAPVTMLFLLLGLYQKDGQNFEQLLIALTSFLVQPRKRVWTKEAVTETFHIEPAKTMVNEQSQRDPAQVRSELDRLAGLVDSRGWNRVESEATSDRLVPPMTPAAQSASVIDPFEASDMMDLQSSPLAQNLTQLLEAASQDVREEAIHAMETTPSGAVAALPTTPAPTTIRTTAGIPQSGIIRLATDSDDITVAQLAAQADRMNPMVEGESVRIGS